MTIENIKVNLPGPGRLALVGSGEYLPPMDPVDRYLLSCLPSPAQVVCLATAAGTEGSERLGYWDNLGVGHFKGLGASVEALPVYDRRSAEDPAYAERIRQANFVYLSGGKPTYLHATLVGTPTWQAILDVLRRGGVVAGCSAGAMIFGARIPTSIFSSNWQEAFGLLEGTFVIPHFDEMPAIMMNNLPALVGDKIMIGVEGNTALLCGPEGLQVIGSGSVTISLGRQRHKFTAADSVI